MFKAECSDCYWACQDTDDVVADMRADAHEERTGHMVVVKDLRRYG